MKLSSIWNYEKLFFTKFHKFNFLKWPQIWDTLERGCKNDLIKATFLATLDKVFDNCTINLYKLYPRLIFFYIYVIWRHHFGHKIKLIRSPINFICSGVSPVWAWTSYKFSKLKKLKRLISSFRNLVSKLKIFVQERCTHSTDERLSYVFFIQDANTKGWTATTRHGVTRKDEEKHKESWLE